MMVSGAVAATGGGGEESKLQLQQQQLSAIKTKGMAQICQKLIQICIASGHTNIDLTNATN